MNTKRVFIGDIKQCIKHNRSLICTNTTNVNDESIVTNYYGYSKKSTIVYKKNAILIKINDDYYIDIVKIESLIDLLKLYYGKIINKAYLNKILMTTSPSGISSIYVDKASLKPYFGDVLRYNEESIPKLKREKHV